MRNQTKNYIGGFVIKKLNTTFFKNCTTCLIHICATSINNDLQLTVAKNYNPGGVKLLKYPNVLFCNLVKNSIKLIRQQLSTICYHNNLKTQLIEMLKEKFNIKIIKCPEHIFSKNF
ncbi:Uncharacterized protein FWK35_00015433 [Aphis craccivora]|uniref:Uncharacterized protein n=1 Tax=Aphis craccivora TaxID=307492 RepID=A0A6G0Y536_APHCR|nr:Uncharacterized protein FWK35_00015433 [Aphis craccivora]